MSEEPAAVFQRRDGVAWVRLNRPAAMNAINEDMRRDLPVAMRAAEADRESRVIVVHGAGERAFCVGADVKEFRAVESPVEYRQSRSYDHWIAPFDAATKPIVCAIHGWCLGGGLEIALACDIRIAAESAQLGFPELSHGTITGCGGSQRLPRVVGAGRAMDIMLTGERMSAAEAYRIGLITRLTPDAGLIAEATRVAELIASRAPLAVRFAKEAVRNALDLELAAGLRRELDLLTHLLQTEDRIEAGAAFREKRKPVFKGR
ncbi:MAG: enoyl-CoA hydratase/isomerase family protein [Burkholderiales bacterium]|nr:enoyl-CoA hydratase/isomerase family protein [Burkholderiales bacterium]